LRKAALSGALWIGIGTAASYALRMVSSVILTRLIAPSVYGMMDLVMVFIVGLHLFSDIGLGVAVTQSRNGENPRFVQTAWTLQAIRGVVLALGSCALAYPVAFAYGRPVLALVFPAMALLPLIEAFYSPGSLLFQRRMQRKWLVVLDLSSGVTTLVATIGGVYLAYPEQCWEVWTGRREALPTDDNLVWAVVVAWILARLACLFVTYVVAAQPRVKFLWDKESAREIFGFGKWIFLSTLLTYFATQSDRLILPKLAGFDAIGLYGRGLSLLGSATGIVVQLQSQVVFPALARLLEREHSERDVFTAVHRVVALSSAVIITGALASGPALSRLLYPTTYTGVDVLIQWLAVSAWFQLLQGSVGSFLLAAGKRRSFVLPQLVKAVALVVFVYPVWLVSKDSSLGAFFGVVAAFLLADLAMYVSVLVVGRRLNLPMLKTDALMSAGVFGFALAARVVGDALVLGLVPGRLGYLLEFAVQGVLSVVPWAVVGWFMHRRRSLTRLA
jgi:O-antigen/teichoic acid export membrane protein